LRKLTKQWQPIIQKRKTAKIGPELYQCPKCQDIVYSGARSIDVIQQEHPNARVGRMDVDHIEPIMEIESAGSAKDWNKIIARMFCPSDNLQVLCSICHKEKSDKEKTGRAAVRRAAKNG
jgi:5-methylcytosine-specific restriction endonuclease McrA